MSIVNELIRFGDVVKLQTKSAFVESATPPFLSFLELPGKTQTQLLVVPPVKDEVKDRLVEAEFIISPIRGDKQQPNGTPLTYQTPFVLKTSDGKDGSTYSLNNKVVGQREGISLQIAATKGEMYIQIEKEDCTKSTDLHYGADGLNLRVVDSNRVRKTLNHLITHAIKPKGDALGGMVTCGAKGTSLTFKFQHVVDAEGNPLTETRKYITNPQARRSSMEGVSPSKMDQLGRADRVDSSEFSDAEAMSRSSSVAGLNSNPASPRGVRAHTLGTPLDASAVAARLPAKSIAGPETPTTVSSSNGSANSFGKSTTPAASPKKTDAKSSVAPPSPVRTPSVKIKIAEIEAATAEAAKADAVKPETPKSAAMKAGTMKVDPVKTTQSQPETKTSTSSTPLAPANTATSTSQATPTEPKTVLADASTFPPTPLIFGPAPAPVVMSPKASTSPKNNTKSGANAATTPASPKMLNEEEVAKLKAEAEVENLQPACGAKCSLM